MAYVLDESSYRIEKNTFPTREEAHQRAEEAARILGRPVTVYELLNQELHFAFRVRPCGEVDETDPFSHHEAEPVLSPAVLGRRQALLDAIAEALEQAGRPDLAAQVDCENEAVAIDSPDDGIRKIVDDLKNDPTINF